MATKIDFPVPSSSGEVFVEPTTNVIYTWVGTPPTNGYWSAFAGEDSDKLDDFFVKVAGDNMTGDLTLGTDKITLDAGNGSATFAGTVTANGTILTRAGGVTLDVGDRLEKVDAALQALKTAAAAASDFAALKSAISTALANI